MATIRQWGLTPPLANTLPTEAEMRLNEALLAELRTQNNFETAEETEKRRKVLAHLQKVTEEFVRHVSKSKGLNPSVVEASGGKVATFGSYRLGVYGPASDIDTLVVAPKHVNRDDFFAHFPKILEKMSPPGAIEESTAVTDAHTPILKLMFTGVDIDLLFCSLAISSVPETLALTDTSLLRGLSEADLRSINGTRVTDDILTLVPQVKSFRLALRAVKLWAQRRAVYANILGFPGGVAWAMLVARICQLYPLACGATIVTKFFNLIHSWPWPRPVQLRNIEDGPLNVRVWNPQIYGNDRRHIMPIITPSYPSMCSTHNITHSTKAIILRELKRADGIVGSIVAGKQSWHDLFAKHTFFTHGYKYYLSIVSASRTKDAQKLWSGLVQSRVRKLVIGIEDADTGVEVAHPFNKGFDRVHQCQTAEEVDLIFQGDLRWQKKEDELITPAEEVTLANGTTDPVESSDSPAPTTIWTTTFYIGLELASDRNPPQSKKLDITHPVATFRNDCLQWPFLDQAVSSLRTVHTRNYDLPLDVFGDGEKRPERAVKAKKTKSKTQTQTTTPARKRKNEGESSASSKKANITNEAASNAVSALPAG